MLQNILYSFISKPPRFYRIYNNVLCRKENTKNVYITFDDGPHPQITPWVIDIAKKYSANLTFFCKGENAQKYPELISLIKQNNHTIGNHGFAHLKAFNTSRTNYIKDILKAQDILNSKLFRPPYGQIFPWYAKKLKETFENIVLWDIMCFDFKPDFKPDEVYNLIKKKIKPGSIIVFHESKKAEKNMKYAFPKTLEFIDNLGYIAERL